MFFSTVSYPIRKCYISIKSNIWLEGILLGFYLYLEYGKKPIILLPLAFSAAIMFYIKGELAVGSLSILVLSVVILLIQKRFKEVIICSAAYVSFIISLWLSLTINGILWAYFLDTDPKTPRVLATALQPPSIASLTIFSGSK